MRTRFQFLMTFFVLVSPVCGQGTFQNLDFESPILPLIADGGFQVPIANALPGWNGYLGAFSTEGVVYNTVGIGSAVISLHDQASFLKPIQGSYSVMLQPSHPLLQTSVAIAQTGQIPSSAQALIFYGAPSMQVTFAGQPIPLVGLSGGLEYSVLGGNISQFAGQIGELRFTVPVPPLSGTMAWLDNIEFSPEPIPEPNTLSLFALGSLLLGWRTCRMRKG